ncbi:MAG: winged helix-turn-helix domain-containing protein [Limisphaerales bacterium]
MKSKSLPTLHPRLRIMSHKKIAVGPGKANLLDLISKTGSIGEAASRMDMSYMRAWSLVREMNKCFKLPIVELARGGHEHGGAKLTPMGRRTLKLYRRMEKDSLKKVQTSWRALRRLLRG